jgi:Holliday junction DNA helicase RuvA
MFSYLIGTVVDKTERTLIIEAHGVGWEAQASRETIAHAKLRSRIKLWTVLKLKVQEGELELYGFGTGEERDLFGLLTSVDKIGPRTAMSILSSAPLDKLVSAIATKNMRFLTEIAGITDKTAHRMVLELSKKVKAGRSDSKLLDADVDLEEALLSLGFMKRDITRVLGNLDPHDKDFRRRISRALTLLKS